MEMFRGRVKRVTSASLKRGGNGGEGGSRDVGGTGDGYGGDDIVIHYPWIFIFDQEAKGKLIDPEVKYANVVKLLTMLESHVSPEVTRLKNKPNRATKFLAHVRNRINMVKMGGYMLGDPECEIQLYPTYGLLMTHVVNITLCSSKIAKYGAQQVAQNLYNFLKLMFNEDYEYILDVALCSTLDEHSSSMHQLGFQMFFFIVEDFRCFSDSHSSQMKYCAVASLLAEASADGQAVVEKTVPSAPVDANFFKFISHTLVIELKKKKPATLHTAIEAIKVTRVKSLARSRLVIVSRKDIAKSIHKREREFDEEESDAESTSSTVVNVVSRSGRKARHETTSSTSTDEGNRLKVKEADSFLSELGLLDFTLDTKGSRSAAAGDYHEVSSSTVPSFHRSSPLPFIKSEEESGDEEMDDDGKDYNIYGEDEDLDDVNDETPKHNNDDQDHERESQEDQDQDDTVSLHGRSQVLLDSENEGDLLMKESRNKEKIISYSGYEPTSDCEQNGILSDTGDGYSDQDQEEEETVDPQEKSSNTATGSTPATGGAISNLDNQLKDTKTDDSDSDLEILSENVNKHNGSDDDSSSALSRDEADPESGEDNVPNYDEDSDEDEQISERTNDRKSKEDANIPVKNLANQNDNKACIVEPESARKDKDTERILRSDGIAEDDKSNVSASFTTAVPKKTERSAMSSSTEKTAGLINKVIKSRTPGKSGSTSLSSSASPQIKRRKLEVNEEDENENNNVDIVSHTENNDDNGKEDKSKSKSDGKDKPKRDSELASQSPTMRNSSPAATMGKGKGGRKSTTTVTSKTVAEVGSEEANIGMSPRRSTRARTCRLTASTAAALLLSSMTTPSTTNRSPPRRASLKNAREESESESDDEDEGEKIAVPRGRSNRGDRGAGRARGSAKRRGGKPSSRK